MKSNFISNFDIVEIKYLGNYCFNYLKNRNSKLVETIYFFIVISNKICLEIYIKQSFLSR